MIVFLIICAVAVLLLAVEMFCAPEGYQNESGFHYGKSDDKEPK